MGAASVGIVGVPSSSLDMDRQGNDDGDAVRPEMFGATADGVTDCTDAFERAISTSTRRRNIVHRQRNRPLALSSGVYRLTRTLRLTGQDVTVRGPGGQSCALLLDHEDDGVIYTGGGDCTLFGFALMSTEVRRASVKRGAGFKSDPGLPNEKGPKSTLRLVLQDFHVHGNAGAGIVLINPEGARLENVTANGNGGYGCHLWGRDLPNILNNFDFCRFRDNRATGLFVENMSASIITRVECLNNRAREQMLVVGSYNQILQPDCEAFSYTGQDRAGVVLRGHANRVVGGVFYKLETAIRLEASHDTIVDYPKIDGTSTQPVRIGVSIDSHSERCAVRLGNSNFVQTAVQDRGSGSIVEVEGRQCLRRPSFGMVRAKVGGHVVPDLRKGHTFHYELLSDIVIGLPNNLQSGDVVTFVVEHGNMLVKCAPEYRGGADALALAAGKSSTVLTFLALSEASLLLQSYSSTS